MSLVLQEINKQYIATPQGLEQVYQNKLVEGRDFERWDWLVGGKANVYIANIPTTSAIFSVIITQGSTTNIVSFGRIGKSELGANFKLSASSANVWTIATGGVSTLITDNTFNFDIGQEKFKCNNVIFDNNKGYAFQTIHIGNANNTHSSTYRISSVRCDTFTLHPVKLLSPCPPNLSANGKVYPIGECGMYDSVSGKFYGNSGSGSFSVYNDSTE